MNYLYILKEISMPVAFGCFLLLESKVYKSGSKWIMSDNYRLGKAYAGIFIISLMLYFNIIG